VLGGDFTCPVSAFIVQVDCFRALSSARLAFCPLRWPAGLVISNVIVVATAQREQAGFLVAYSLPWFNQGTKHSRTVSI
jgi:hypothetical protein